MTTSTRSGPCFAFVVLMLLSGAGLVRAQKLDPMTAGLSYVIGFPDTTTNTSDNRFPNPMADTILLMIYSAVNNNVSIQGNGYTNRITPQAGKFMLVYLNDSRNRAAAPIVTTAGQVSRNVFRINAKEPIIIYAYYMTKFGGEAFTPIPVESWGMEYYAAAMPGEVVVDASPGTGYVKKRNKMGPAEILIVAAFDNTNVTIVPTAKTVWHNFPPMTVKLDENQAYQVQSFIDTIQSHAGEPQPDIGGVYIVADKPIGVVSGNSRGPLNERQDNSPRITGNSGRNMLIEWLAPTEQHGREFVYLPTWDSRHVTGQPGEVIDEKRQGEYIRVYNSVQTSNSNPLAGRRIDQGTSTTFALYNQGFHEHYALLSRPVVYRTDSAAQAFMASSPVLRVTPGPIDNDFDSSYDAWGGYMVEMVPREQWPSFAPYYAPAHPSGMEHFINVAVAADRQLDVFTETGVRFNFNRGAISGTDLVWGTMPVTVGTIGYLEGRNGATFYAFAYGSRKGIERSRYFSSKHYDEKISVAYGYPLAPRRRVLAEGDSLLIDTAMDCTDLTILIRAINANPVGLRSVTLDPSPVATFNTKLVAIDPAKLPDILGKSKGTVRVVPLDRDEDARATVIIEDRSGKITRVYYRYEAEQVYLDPEDILNFGEVTLGEQHDSSVTITNPLQKTIRIVGLHTHLGLGNGFEVIDPKLDADDTITLAAGGTMNIKIRFGPTEENKLYEDTLIVEMGCSRVKLPIRGETVAPCVYVDDLHFGIVVLGRDGPKTFPLDICNTGRGIVRFLNSSGGGVLQWLRTGEFTVPQSTIDSMRDHVMLGPNDCYRIHVTFTPTAIGNFRDTATFHTTAECDREISVWTAMVIDSLTLGVDDHAAMSGGAMTGITPNPSSGRTSIGFRLAARCHARLVIVDATGEEVARLIDGQMEPGDHRVEWDAVGNAAGIYFCRLQWGGGGDILPIVVVR